MAIPRRVVDWPEPKLEMAVLRLTEPNPLTSVVGDAIRLEHEEAGLSVAEDRTSSFTDFVVGVERRLRQSLTASLGPELGREAAAEALAYGWEHWDRVGGLENPAGYLYRVGLNWGRKAAGRKQLLFPAVEPKGPDWIEPKLPEALARLPEKQRTVVYLVHGLEWSLAEVASLLEVSKGTVQKHLERGMGKLRRQLKVESST